MASITSYVHMTEMYQKTQIRSSKVRTKFRVRT